jgi:copper chaperone NosL
MMTRRRLLGALLGGAVVLTTGAGCGDDAEAADKPPKVAYGEDQCDRCKMIVSEERFAAGLVPKKGKARIFDDAGELIMTLQEEGNGLGKRRAWVHDYDTKQWIDASTASFVDSHKVVSPMGTGVAAFGTREAADAFASQNAGTVRDWQQMLSGWTMHQHSH